MSRKALITILFITTVVVLIFIISINSISYSHSYKYDLVNTTNDKSVEETSDEMIENVQDSEKIIINEEFVQGVKITTYSNITYDVYSNGYKEITNNIESVEFDNSGYNGSTKSLKNQANENVELYYEKINSVLETTNQYRNEVGLNTLTLDKGLCIAASVRALEMSYTEKLSHTRPDGAKCFIVLQDLNINYTSAGENIADGFKYTESVCNAWKNSESHYKNIICNKYV